MDFVIIEGTTKFSDSFADDVNSCEKQNLWGFLTISTPNSHKEYRWKVIKKESFG